MWSEKRTPHCRSQYDSRRDSLALGRKVAAAVCSGGMDPNAMSWDLRSGARQPGSLLAEPSPLEQGGTLKEGGWGGKEALPVPHPSLQRKNKWQHVCLQEETRRERMAVNLLLWGVQKRGDVNKAPIKPFRQEGNMCPADWNACFLEKKWGP